VGRPPLQLLARSTQFRDRRDDVNKITLGGAVTVTQGEEVVVGTLDGFQREPGGVTLEIFIPDPNPQGSGEGDR
jgi:hypothetical protein